MEKRKEFWNKKKVIGVTCALLVLAGMSITVYAYDARYEAKQEVYTIELGKQFNSKKVDSLIDANAKALSGTKVDASKVDTSKVGTYEVKASYQKKEAIFTVKVQDTVAPSVKLEDNGEYKLIVGAKLQADKIVEKMEDLSGIKKVEFQDNEYLNEDATDDALTDKGISYEKAGAYENAVLITDGNKNVATLKFKVTVVEDYEKHVTGIKDISVTTGTAVDYMSGVTKDDKISEVKVDSSKVDLNKAGDYTVTYTIIGDDKKTTIKKTAKVKVSDPVVESSSDAGTLDASAGNGYASAGDVSGSGYYSGNDYFYGEDYSYSGGGGDAASGGGSSSSSGSGWTDEGVNVNIGNGSTAHGGTFDPSQFGY